MLRLTVKVTVSPTLGAELLTVLARARPACCGVEVALASLLLLSGSNWSAVLIVAEFVCAVELTTWAVIVNVWGAPGLTEPTVHTPPATAKNQCLG